MWLLSLGCRHIRVALFPHPSWAAASASNSAWGVVIVQSCRIWVRVCGVWHSVMMSSSAVAVQHCRTHTHTRLVLSRLLNNSVDAARRSIASLNVITSRLLNLARIQSQDGGWVGVGRSGDWGVSVEPM